MSETTWRAAALRLADEITKDTPRWHEAVRSTPRHMLVPRWWTRRPDGTTWDLAAHPADSEAQIEAAYSDQTLVTRVGPLHSDEAQPGQTATGSPTSSSTLPGLIIAMLDLLDPSPAGKILDVGTGSGYATALLCHELGSDRVTSLDVDDYLTQAARTRLAALGHTPTIYALDATSELPGGGYDALLATVSVRPVPAVWMRALRPGGRLVVTIAGTPLLIAADMHADGIARGVISSQPASFMIARREADYAPRLDDLYRTARQARDGAQVRESSEPMPDLWQGWELHTLYELDAPGVELRTVELTGSRELYLLAADGSWARVEDDGESVRVHQDGPRRLYDRLEAVRRDWDEAGRPALTGAQVTIEADGTILLDSQWWHTHVA
jgi:protein-L-isoaspartate O-methyltransferase